MKPFTIKSDYKPTGDQPKAIESLVRGLREGGQSQVLLGITGSGKTFTIANVIQEVQRPTLIIAPNKTLAAQLYGEFKAFFPDNAVEYFVSYYDYYQPEAYVASTDTFIEKDSQINDDIDRMRHSATRSLLSRRDTIIVASVSCIYGIGSREWYQDMLIKLEQGQSLRRDELLHALVNLHYERKDNDFHRGTFRVRGDVIDIFPVYEEHVALRVEYWGDTIERLVEIDALRGTPILDVKNYGIHPGSHYVTPEEVKVLAAKTIRDELLGRLQELEAHGKVIERHRLEQRTLFDLEMLEQAGFCHGIENYSRHFSGRKPGEPPPTLLDYFPDDYLLVIDESHQTVPQIGAMYRGDRARKETLVEHGFRLPSALDNRPLQFDEFKERAGQTIYVSATPGDYELKQSEGEIIEQIVRPTGLLDPLIHVRPVAKQVDDLLGEIRIRVERGERVLVTTLTKRMSEDLSEYYREQNNKVKYLHSDIETLERIEILADLRKGVFDVLIGINLLREGLDLPEVSLVAILDADKEGFLRSPRSLIQTIGRAARNQNGEVIMYADTITRSMQVAIGETERRRAVQIAYNKERNIVPKTIRKEIMDLRPEEIVNLEKQAALVVGADVEAMNDEELHQAMVDAAEALDFERAAMLRNALKIRRGEAPTAAGEKALKNGKKMLKSGKSSARGSAKQGKGSRAARAR